MSIIMVSEDCESRGQFNILENLNQPLNKFEVDLTSENLVGNVTSRFIIICDKSNDYK